MELPVVQYEPGVEYDPAPAEADFGDMIYQPVPPPEEEPELTPEERRYLTFSESAGEYRENYASPPSMEYSISLGNVCRFDERRQHTEIGVNCPHTIGRDYRERYGAPQRSEPAVPHVRHWRRYGSA